MYPVICLQIKDKTREQNCSYVTIRMVKLKYTSPTWPKILSIYIAIT